MSDFPEDIFTEPEDVDPDTLANLGPLRRLAGTWEGIKGVDLNPKADGPERREFTERMVFEPIDPQANGPSFFTACAITPGFSPPTRMPPSTIRSAIGCGSPPPDW